MVRMMVFMVVAMACLFLLRSVWRMLVEIPDVRQVWVPDAVDDFLSRSISLLLLASSGLFLVVAVQAVA